MLKKHMMKEGSKIHEYIEQMNIVSYSVPLKSPNLNNSPPKKQQKNTKHTHKIPILCLTFLIPLTKPLSLFSLESANPPIVKKIIKRNKLSTPRSKLHTVQARTHKPPIHPVPSPSRQIPSFCTANPPIQSHSKNIPRLSSHTLVIKDRPIIQVSQFLNLKHHCSAVVFDFRDHGVVHQVEHSLWLVVCFLFVCVVCLSI